MTGILSGTICSQPTAALMSAYTNNSLFRAPSGASTTPSLESDGEISCGPARYCPEVRQVPLQDSSTCVAGLLLRFTGQQDHLSLEVIFTGQLPAPVFVRVGLCPFQVLGLLLERHPSGCLRYGSERNLHGEEFDNVVGNCRYRVFLPGGSTNRGTHPVPSTCRRIFFRPRKTVSFLYYFAFCKKALVVKDLYQT